MRRMKAQRPAGRPGLKDVVSAQTEAPKPEAPKPDVLKSEAPKFHALKLKVPKPRASKLDGLKPVDLKPVDLKPHGPKLGSRSHPQRLLTACSADVPKEQPLQCARCVRFHQRQLPCPYL